MPGGMHSAPEDGKRNGVLQALHNKTHRYIPARVVVKIFKGESSYSITERRRRRRLVLWKENEVENK